MPNVSTTDNTRMACAIFDRSSGTEYRVVPPGPQVSEKEWAACLSVLEGLSCDYLVASGSLPPGVPSDFYARIADHARRRGIRMVLDSSGPGLVHGLLSGGIHLLKPSVGELQQIAGRELGSDADIAAEAEALVQSGRAEIVAVTMGKRGAILACAGQATLQLPALPVDALSTSGAGDSFLAAMVYSLALGEDVSQAFRRGIAAGAAAVLSPGTSLAHPHDISRLYAALPVPG